MLNLNRLLLQSDQRAGIAQRDSAASCSTTRDAEEEEHYSDACECQDGADTDAQRTSPTQNAVVAFEQAEMYGDAPLVTQGSAATAAAVPGGTPITAPSKIGPHDFEILRVVGKGAFGKVFQVGLMLQMLHRPLVMHTARCCACCCSLLSYTSVCALRTSAW